MRELRPAGLVHLSLGEFFQRPARDRAEAVGIDLVERDADDAAAGDEAGAAEMEQPGQELSARKIARGAHEDHHLRVFRPDP